MKIQSDHTRVLVIDDDEAVGYSLHRVLAAQGYEVKIALGGEEGIDMAGEENFDVIFLDNRMEGMDGLQTLKLLKGSNQSPAIILMTAFGTTQTAIEAIKFGAYDYIMKPFEGSRVCALVEAAVSDRSESNGQSEALQPLWAGEEGEEGMVGDSESMQLVFKTIGRVAPSDITVLITGESGTGKELVARCIFKYSQRNKAPYLAVNCAAIPENLIESELFGHEKGAFTGANEKRVGKFELCHGGTIFLDEIGDMSLPAQTRLLRVLQEGEIQRVGGSATIKVNVRVIAATNRNLEKRISQGLFREDLFYRLHVVPIHLSPLRERVGDIPRMVNYFLARMAKKEPHCARRLSYKAQQKLMNYRWPGNVRELENVIQRCVIVAQSETILLKDLPPEILMGEKLREPDAPGTSEIPPARTTIPETAPLVTGDLPAPPVSEIPSEKIDEIVPAQTAPPLTPEPLGTDEIFDLVYKQVRAESDTAILSQVERELIRRALQETRGNQVKTSNLLGMARVTLRKRITEYEIRY